MPKWIPTTKAEYEEMYGILPPALWRGQHPELPGAFMVGEVSTYKETGSAYTTFVELDGKYYVADEPLTRTELRSIGPATVRAHITENVIESGTPRQAEGTLPAGACGSAHEVS